MQKCSCSVVIAGVQLCMGQVLVIKPFEELVKSDHRLDMLAGLQQGHSFAVKLGKGDLQVFLGCGQGSCC